MAAALRGSVINSGAVGGAVGSPEFAFVVGWAKAGCEFPAHARCGNGVYAGGGKFAAGDAADRRRSFRSFSDGREEKDCGEQLRSDGNHGSGNVGESWARCGEQF